MTLVRPGSANKGTFTVWDPGGCCECGIHAKVPVGIVEYDVESCSAQHSDV